MAKKEIAVKKYVGKLSAEERKRLEALIHVGSVARTRQQLVEEGFEATLSRKYNPNSARPRIFDGAA